MTDMRALVLAVCGTDDPLRLILRGGAVRRYHTEEGMAAQTVAEHTWRLMVILLHLWPDASPRLLTTALYHDVPEGLFGDAPAPVKRDPVLKAAYDVQEAEYSLFLGIRDESALNPAEYARLKCADYLELCMTCLYQDTPNSNRIFATGARYVRERAMDLPIDEAHRVIAFLARLEGPFQ